MRRILVIANQTLGGKHLERRIRQLLQEGPCRFHLLVPASPPPHQAWTEGEALALARERLREALERFQALGAEVEGELGRPGDESPVPVIREVLERDPNFDLILLSTLPPGISRWIGMDLPHRVSRLTYTPVEHIIGEAEPTAST